jgi:hypothetical protein
MSELRRISARGMAKLEHSPLDRGAKPEFAWIPIANLRVDDSYQRPLKPGNIKAIRKIATYFSWIKFGALKVAPIPDTSPALYSIMDGQHRATALDLLGISQAPCLVIDANEAQQAAAFAAINGDVMRVLPLQNFAALVRAEDPEAMSLTRIVGLAGVEICRYAVPIAALKPGQTLALGTLKFVVKRYGADITVLALNCITKTANNLPGAVHANVIAALCELLSAEPKLAAQKGLLKRFDDIELDTLDSDSRAEKPRHIGDTARARLRDKIKAALDAQQAVAA